MVRKNYYKNLMRCDEHRKLKFYLAIIYFLIISVITIGVSTCTSYKTSHNKSYGKMKNKSIKIKEK